MHDIRNINTQPEMSFLLLFSGGTQKWTLVHLYGVLQTHDDISLEFINSFLSIFFINLLSFY